MKKVNIKQKPGKDKINKKHKNKVKDRINESKNDDKTDSEKTIEGRSGKEIERIRTYPYTFDQLRYFENEILEAGGVDELMLQKEALIRTDGQVMIATYKDIEGYRLKYLNGIYESLRANYNTEVPYVFWSNLFEILKRI